MARKAKAVKAVDTPVEAQKAVETVDSGSVGIHAVIKDIYDEIDRVIAVLGKQFGIKIEKSTRLGLKK